MKAVCWYGKNTVEVETFLPEGRHRLDSRRIRRLSRQNPFGAAFNKGLTLKMGQTHMHKYMQPLLDRIQKHEIDPSFIITHRLRLEDAPRGYEIFKHKQDGSIKIVLTP